jgi:hypothetical protein
MSPVRSTVPPSGAVPAPGAGWGVRRAEGLVFPHPAVIARDPAYIGDLAVYLTDLLRHHGIALDHAALAAGGQSYKEMAEALIGRIVPDGERIDLLVLAYAVPVHRAAPDPAVRGRRRPAPRFVDSSGTGMAALRPRNTGRAADRALGRRGAVR